MSALELYGESDPGNDSALREQGADTETTYIGKDTAGRGIRQQPTLDINNAFDVLRPLIESVPNSEWQLTMPPAATAWKALHEFHPSLFATWKSEVRSKCGKLAARAIDDIVERLSVHPGAAGGDIIVALDISEL